MSGCMMQHLEWYRGADLAFVSKKRRGLFILSVGREKRKFPMHPLVENDWKKFVRRNGLWY